MTGFKKALIGTALAAAIALNAGCGSYSLSPGKIVENNGIKIDCEQASRKAHEKNKYLGEHWVIERIIDAINLAVESKGEFKETMGFIKAIQCTNEGVRTHVHTDSGLVHLNPDSAFAVKEDLATKLLHEGKHIQLYKTGKKFDGYEGEKESMLIEQKFYRAHGMNDLPDEMIDRLLADKWWETQIDE